MDTRAVIETAARYLTSLSGEVFDVFSLSKPASVEEAVNLSKVVSKVSPLIGNMIEFRTVEFLNAQDVFKPHGRWRRQDPGFPDTIFEGKVQPTPGLEIKTWFPLATEITARFRESQRNLANNATCVGMLAWLPERLIYGRPYILDVVVVPARSVAEARDTHYHNPPDYLVIEPEDTASRTANLQQTNTNGYKWQGTPAQFRKAKRIVASWGNEATQYRPTREYQDRLRELVSRFPYRLDTNFAKMDRIVHAAIEDFKTRVSSTTVNGMSLRDWARIFVRDDEDEIRKALRANLAI